MNRQNGSSNSIKSRKEGNENTRTVCGSRTSMRASLRCGSTWRFVAQFGASAFNSRFDRPNLQGQRVESTNLQAAQLAHVEAHCCSERQNPQGNSASDAH